MSDAFRPPWVYIPIGLTLVFAVLFFPVARQRYELLTTLVFTFIGGGVIWAAYLVRAHIFSGWAKDETGKTGRRG